MTLLEAATGRSRNLRTRTRTHARSEQTVPRGRARLTRRAAPRRGWRVSLRTRMTRATAAHAVPPLRWLAAGFRRARTAARTPSVKGEPVVDQFRGAAAASRYRA